MGLADTIVGWCDPRTWTVRAVGVAGCRYSFTHSLFDAFFGTYEHYIVLRCDHRHESPASMRGS